MHGIAHFETLRRLGGEKTAAIVASTCVTTLPRIGGLKEVARSAEQWLLVSGISLVCEKCFTIVVGAKRPDYHDECWNQHLAALATELHSYPPAVRSQLLGSLESRYQEDDPYQ